MGGTQMPTYISLVNLTEQGIKEVKNAPERLRFFDDAAKAAGGRLIGFYLVMGQFDYVVITEAPDDQTAARLILGTIAQGSVRTQTMRAFPREELEIEDRKSTRLNSSHLVISYAVFCLKKKI